jgi:hypothetical protein
LFSPWGPRYNNRSPKIEENDPETNTLREIKNIFNKFNDLGYTIKFLLMPADAYGTEVNNLSQTFVTDYFKWLEDRTNKELKTLNQCDVEVKLWSEIREEQKNRYDTLSFEIDQNFNSYIKDGEFQNAMQVAKVFNPKNAQSSARKYCIERLVEGNIINEIYTPIKLSLVRKEKDTLDGPLKRIYLIKNRAPWLGGK